MLWPSKRRKVIRRRPEDELGAKVSVAAESEVIKVLLELGDFVRGLDRSHARGIIVLLEPDTLDGVVGPKAGRTTLGLRIALFVEALGMNTVIPIID